jgi:transcriptional regulator with XRE-family HTH domain
MSPRADTTKSLAPVMGARLRERRTELGLSLSEVARRASVSASYLTAVENGSSTASLPVLSRIAHALDLTIGEFLAGQTASTVELGHLDDTPGIVTVSSKSLALQVAFQNAEPGESGSAPFEPNGASVIIYVRAGTVDVIVDDEEWHLGDGDSLHAQEPQSVTWRTHSRATLVWAVAPPEII